MSDAEIKALARKIREDTLRLRCWPADGTNCCRELSEDIWRAFRRRRVAARLALGLWRVGMRRGRLGVSGHWWVVIDGRILDVTATQFLRSAPKVWFPADPWRYLECEPIDGAEDVRQARVVLLPKEIGGGIGTLSIDGPLAGLRAHKPAPRNVEVIR